MWSQILVSTPGRSWNPRKRLLLHPHFFLCFIKNNGGGLSTAGEECRGEKGLERAREVLREGLLLSNRVDLCLRFRVQSRQ